MCIYVKIAYPYPEKLDHDEVLRAVPGGLSVRRLDIPALGRGDTIVVALAALTVYVDIDITR